MFRNLFRKLRQDEAGLSTMEYAVLFVIVVVGGLGLWTTLGTNVNSRVGAANEAFNTALLPGATGGQQGQQQPQQN
ncbi:MAG: hypothetical protein OXU20_40765 [Myxococcales bacterium]|nr:hypothetical protein [Myxococcales bacterium]